MESLPMKKRLTLVAFEHMTCGCKEDADAGYMLVCPMHLHAYNMLEFLNKLDSAIGQPVLKQQLRHVIDMANGRC